MAGALWTEHRITECVIDAIRSVMLEGTTLSSLGWELGSMLIRSVVSFALALKFFRWG